LFGLVDPESRAVFYPADVELLRVQAEGSAFFDEERVQHMTRAVGAGTRNIIDASIALFRSSFGGRDELPAEDYERFASAAFPLLRRLIYALPALLMHQYREAMDFLGDSGVELTLAVAFCDLVDSTPMANASPNETARAVAEFETHAADAVAQRGGRLVKFVGDEVVFATNRIEDAREIAFDVLSWVADHAHLSLARAGLAHGLVLFATATSTAPRSILLLGW
jgi:adenylate cyclase